jgi:hypothetical protein
MYTDYLAASAVLSDMMLVIATLPLEFSTGCMLVM